MGEKNGAEDKKKEGECVGERDSVKHDVSTQVGGREKNGAEDKRREENEEEKKR